MGGQKMATNTILKCIIFEKNDNAWTSSLSILKNGSTATLFQIIAHEIVMSYYHPRDFDAEQPVLQHLPAMRRFKSYAGLSRAFRKFEYWLNDFETVSLLQADKQTEWKKTKIISL